MLVTVGISGAWIANLVAFEPYRPNAIGVALVCVGKVATSLEQKEAVVTFDDAKTNVDALRKATTSAGYPSAVKQ